MNLADTAILWLIVFFSAIVQSLAGIGGALVATPLMTVVIGVKSAIVIYALPQLAISIWLAYKARADVIWREIWPLLVTGMIGVVLGDRLLNTLDIRLIQALLGIAVLLFACDMLAREIKQESGERPSWPPAAKWVGGLCAGVILGLLGTPGPPLVIILMHRPLDVFQVRACVLMIATILSGWRLVTYFASGTLSGPLQIQGLALLPVAIAGAVLGVWLLPILKEKQLRLVVVAVLFLAGTLALVG